MATYAREATIRQLPAKLWHPSFYLYDMRNTVLLTTPVPVLPPLFYDTTQWQPIPKWNSAVNFDYPNITVTLPNANPSTPTRSPDFGPPAAPRRNASLYFEPPNTTLNMQMSLIGFPIRATRFDPTQRFSIRQPLSIDYGPNLSVALLNSNPYIPVDVSGQIPAPRRNSSLYFEYPNLAERSAGLQPVASVDLTPRFIPRQPIVFDAPNLALLLPTGARPIVPLDVSPPIRALQRCGSIYEAQGTLLTSSLFLPAVLSPGSDVDFNYDSIALRFKAQQIPLASTWIEPQRALLSKPVVTAAVPNLSYSANSGIQTYNAGSAFSGAVSYSIAPATDAGITFSTVTGVISTDTGVAAVAAHGPYIITATNTNGSIAGNSFTITVTSGNYHVDGPRVTMSTTSLGTTYTVSGPRVVRDVPESEDLS